MIQNLTRKKNTIKESFYYLQILQERKSQTEIWKILDAKVASKNQGETS